MPSHKGIPPAHEGGDRGYFLQLGKMRLHEVIEKDALQILKRKVEQLMTDCRATESVKHILIEAQSSFLAVIVINPLPKSFKMLTIPLYDSKTDPTHHIKIY